jgi:hypothetical protein
MKIGDQKHLCAITDNQFSRKLDHEVLQRRLWILLQNVDELLERNDISVTSSCGASKLLTMIIDAPVGPSHARCSSLQADIQTWQQ